MKKFLSLVLALVMTMSLVTISAGAKDFTDDASINYKEAVGVMSELKIVDGDTTGAFNPQGKLTRGAAAKIICNMILGPTTAAALATTSAPFPDVPADHVFAGYIAYCVEQGIISGYTDGTFKPSNPLTGYAFLKMLLGALGYDQYVEGYAVPNWSVNVAKQAIAIGLEDGNDNFDGTAIVNREEALLYAFNTMKATMVDYSSKVEVKTDANSTVTISGGRFDVETESNKVDYNESEDGKVQFVEKYFSKVGVKVTEDAFGRYQNTWSNGKKDLGSYLIAPDALYHADVKEATIYADVDLSAAYEFEMIVDGIEEDGTFIVNKKNVKADDQLSENADGLVGNGSDVYVYIDEDETSGRIVVINTFLAEVGDDYDDKDETLDIDAIAMLKYSDWDGEVLKTEDGWKGLDKYADGDYVLITTADGVIKTIKKAEPVAATVTEYVHSESVTADGEEYSYSVASKHNDDDGDDYSYELKTSYDLYLDEEGYVLYAKGATAASKYLYIAEFSAHSNSKRAAADAYAYFIDGTEAEIKVSKINTASVTAFDVAQDSWDHTAGWYKYTVKNDKYELTWVEDDTDVTATEYQTVKANVGAAVDVINYKVKHTEITDGTTIKDGNSKTNFIILDAKNNVKVYTGIRNVPEVLSAADTVVHIHYAGSYAKNVFIDLNKGEMGSADVSDDIIFLLAIGNQGNDPDNDEYYKYTALKNGEKATIKVDKAVFTGEETFYKQNALLMDVEYTGKNYVSDADVVAGLRTNRDDTTAQLIGNDTVTYSEGTLELGNDDNNDYFLADSYEIYVIADGDYDTYNAGQLVRAATKGTLKLKGYTAYGILNEDGEYTALYIVKPKTEA